MKTNTTSHPRKSEPHSSTQRLAQTVMSIARLPGAPSFDWTTQAAHTLQSIHPHTNFGVAIVKHAHEHDLLSTESSGVNLAPTTQSQPEPNQARSSLERLSTSVINISDTAKKLGCVAPITHTFPQCAASKASIPWAPAPPFPSLAAYAPLPETHNTHSNTSIALIILANPDISAQSPIDPEMLAAALAAMTLKAAQALRTDNSDAIHWLTQREQVILEQLIDGNSVRAIAQILGRSPHTVHDHIKNLHRKLGATSRAQLIARALGHQHSTTQTQLVCPIIDPVLYQSPTLPQTATELKPAPSTLQQQPRATPLISPAHRP